MTCTSITTMVSRTKEMWRKGACVSRLDLKEVIDVINPWYVEICRMCQCVCVNIVQVSCRGWRMVWGSFLVPRQVALHPLCQCNTE